MGRERTAIGAAVVVAVVSLFAGRAEAQQVCGYGVPCVVYASPTVTAVPARGPELAPEVDAPVRTRRRWGLVTAGAVMLGAGWALNIGGSALWSIMPTQHDPEYFGLSLIPVIGPFAQLANLGGQDWQIPILLTMGAVQATGLVLAIVGTATTEEVRDAAATAPVVVPYASADGAGASLAMAF